MEQIRIVRRGKLHKAGTFQKGFTAQLTLGDRVYGKMPHQHWRKKFSLVVHDGYPAIKYGERYGHIPGQARALKNLPQEAFDNAGLFR